MEVPRIESIRGTELELKLKSLELSSEEQLAIEQLELPIKRIAEELKTELVRGDYGLMIGDDASGRVPARMLWHVAKSLAKNPKEAPPLRFFAGSRNLAAGSDEWKHKKTIMRDHIAAMPQMFPHVLLS